MDQAPPAAAPAAPLVVVAYDLRDGSNANASLAPPNIVELPPSARISHLQQAVFAANANTLHGRDYTQLDIYPPGITDWTDRSAAADAEEDIARLLPAPDITNRTRRRFIVIARPLPLFGGARGQSSLSAHGTFSPLLPSSVLQVNALRSACAVAGIVVQQRVIDRLLRDAELLIILQSCYERQQYIDVYDRASRRLGSSTKGAVLAVDRNRNIVLDGLFLSPSTTSDFYYAFEAGVPCLLKLSKMADGMQMLVREHAAYRKAIEGAHAGVACLVDVELIELDVPRPQLSSSFSPRIQALKMQIFVRTLEDCPFDHRLAELYLKAGSKVLMAMRALHHVGLVHCDIKPSNIFVTSSGDVLLGDYDAVVAVDEPVIRSTSRFLPEPYRSHFENGTLRASKAIDYAMLSVTLLACLGVELTPHLQIDRAIVDMAGHLERSAERAEMRSAAMAAIHNALSRILELLRQLQGALREQSR